MRLNIINLTLVRGQRTIAGPLDISLSDGDYLAIRGPNGVGKSTLLRTIAGLLREGTGRIEIVGHSSEPNTPVRELVHYFGHLDGLKSALTVRENLLYAGKISGGEESGLDAQSALEQVDLLHAIDLPVSFLSAGMRKRAAFARLLVSQRPIWLLDEPTSAMDSTSVERLGEIMNGHLSNGGIILAATHLPLPGSKQKTLEMSPASIDELPSQDFFL